MKNIKVKIFIISLFIASVFLLNFSAVPVWAAENQIDALEQEIFNYNLIKYDVSGADSFVNDALPGQVGIDSEWYVMALSQTGRYNFSNYVKALDEYVATHKVQSATTRQKFALAYIAVGENRAYIQDTLEDTVGKQGLMSYVYALHLVNNGYSHSLYTNEDIINEIISRKNSDGGWSVNGSVSDVDVTAMTLQALSPYYNNSSEIVDDAVNSALEFLSASQLDNGEYVSYGVSNPESGSQVIIALSALKIDFQKDSRFIKNGNTILDGILRFKLPDGSFSHTLGGKTNLNSTVQVFFLASAYRIYKTDDRNIYLFDNNRNDSEDDTDIFSSLEISSIDESQTISENADKYSIQSEDSLELFSDDCSGEKGISLKIIFLVVIVCLSLGVAVILYINGKRNIKNYIVLIISTSVLVCFVMLSDIKSKDEYYTSSLAPKENVYGVVTISIECKSVVDELDSSYISSDGIILAETEFEIEEGDTVYDVLMEAARKYSIHIENNGNDSMAYIAGINYLYEFEHGDLSGWMYYVNGEEASEGCTSYKLSDGDRIQWRYSTEMGKDMR